MANPASTGCDSRRLPVKPRSHKGFTHALRTGAHPVGSGSKGRYTAHMPDKMPSSPPEPPPIDDDSAYPCIGVCMADPESGLCQGCGRPLAEPQAPEADGVA